MLGQSADRSTASPPAGAVVAVPASVVAGVSAAVVAGAASVVAGAASVVAGAASVVAGAAAVVAAPPDTDAPTYSEAPSGEPLPTEGVVEVAAGTTLNLDECPGEWSATQGAEGDEIRIGWSGPQSGALAAFGQIGEGMQWYFDYINETDPIGDQQLVLVTRDDGYEAGRAVANVEEMMATEDIFIFSHLIGTPINAAVRAITDEACVPQLYNSTGFPAWGDPANFPWTNGGILNYVTEANIWCDAIVEEFGEGATVAALYMNNDFGKSYQNTLNECADAGQIEVVVEALHDPAAPDVSNEMTTMIASDADVFVAGTTAAFCPQTVATLAGAEWRPRFYMSYTCNNLASFFTPVQDAAGTLAAEGSGVRMVNSNKVCGDPAYEDDPAIQQVREILQEYGGVNCEDCSFSTGILFGEGIVNLLRNASELPGGLNRVNVMAALWNYDGPTSELVLGGTFKLDGVNDAYLIEAGQIQEVQVADGALTFVSQGEFTDLEGQAGSVSGG